jgi:hypothetical protein
MSQQDQLPAGVKDFVLHHLESVAELEALLLLRTDPAPGWTIARLAQRLYIPEAAAGVVLHALHRRGLLSRDADDFRYDPTPESLRIEVEALAEAYPRFLIPITHMIHAKPRASLREFADAFRLREEE